MTSPVSPSLQSMQHDKTYYIHSADLVFLVENLLFRVHRYFFERESVYFKTLFATPHDENEPAPGSSDSSAIMLDTTASQFSRFVWVFYNPKFSLYDEATLEDWKSILELSHRWLFPEIKQLAIRQLQKQPLSPVQRIELYHRNFVDRTFLISDYLSLCQRPSPLSLREGLDLGLETTLMIARTREEIRTPRSPEGVMTPLTPTLQGPELIDLIGKLFVTSENNNNDKNDGGEDDDIGQSATTTILINGVPEPKKTPTVTNGHSNSISGGSPLKPQVTKQTEQANKQNQARGKQRNQAKKKVNPNENLALGEPTGPKPTTTTTSQTAETKKGAATENEERTQNKEAEQIQTPVAGQQGVGAGAGGSANGGQNNQENEKDSSKVKGDEKPGATVVGTEAEKKTEGAVDAQGAGAGGTGEPLGSNGDTGQTNGDVDKDKTTGTQGSPTTAKPTGPGTPVNGVSTNNDESLVAS